MSWADPIRVFVGCAPNDADLESQAVLEWSIVKHSSRPVDITWMQLNRNPDSLWFSDPEQGLGWRTETWATPFSCFRFSVPRACDYEGKAIYTDSDVIFLADIAELWDQQFKPGKCVMGKGGGSWRLCVSLWDCAAARGWLPDYDFLRSNPHSHANLCATVRNGKMVQAFEGNWNCLDGEDLDLTDPSLKALHYTAMSNQPHLRHAIPRLAAEGRKHWYDGKVEPHWRKDVIELFECMLVEAKDNGFRPENYAVPPFGDFRKRGLKNYRPGRRVA